VKKLDFYLAIALAVFTVWLSVGAEESKRVNYLFGATYILIHAYGRRILEAIKSEDEVSQ
jgi:hypothetical protein